MLFLSFEILPQQVIPEPIADLRMNASVASVSIEALPMNGSGLENQVADGHPIKVTDKGPIGLPRDGRASVRLWRSLLLSGGAP